MTAISVIIPALNEEKNIGGLVNYLFSIPHQTYLHEVIVVDGGSQDRTTQEAQKAGAFVLESPKGRAIQMNLGADRARGNILYFVHADVIPPRSCFGDIMDALKQGNVMGCFSYDFASSSSLLKINAYFTQFDSMTTGGGDQTFFIPKAHFQHLGRFKENLPIMEDFDFIWRAKKHHPLHIVKKRALVSARKYEKNSYLKVQLVNGLVLTLFRRGYCPFKLARLYKRLLQL